MKTLFKNLGRTLALAGVLFVSAPTDSLQAQEESAETEDRATQFRTTGGARVDRVPGGKLLIGAYGLAWAAILLFMWLRIDRQQKRATGELERLASVVDRHLAADDKGGS